MFRNFRCIFWKKTKKWRREIYCLMQQGNEDDNAIREWIALIGKIAQEEKLG